MPTLKQWSILFGAGNNLTDSEVKEYLLAVQGENYKKMREIKERAGKRNETSNNPNPTISKL